jgi:hypothetical protein
MSEKRKHRFAPSLETLESRDGPSAFSLGSYAGYTLSRPFTPVVRALGRVSYLQTFTITVGARVEAYAENHRNQTVPWQPANYGNEQCTDLVLAALNSAGAKTNADLGPTGPNADYVWGTLALRRTPDGSNVGQWSDVKPGDILQFRDVNGVDLNGNGFGAPHHSAIVKANLGNGRITVLEQNSNGHHYVEEHSYDLGNATGTIWAYHPIAR